MRETTDGKKRDMGFRVYCIRECDEIQPRQGGGQRDDRHNERNQRTNGLPCEYERSWCIACGEWLGVGCRDTWTAVFKS